MSKREMDHDLRRRMEEEMAKQEQRLKALDDIKSSYSYKLSLVCRSRDPRCVMVDESKALKFIGHKHYIFDRIGLEWRVGKTVANGRGSLDYKSVWMDTINRLHYAASLEDLPADLPLYYKILGIDRQVEEWAIEDCDIEDQVLMTMASMTCSLADDLAIERCLMPPVDDGFDYEDFYEANFD